MNSWMYSASELYNMKGFSERDDPIERSSSSPNISSTTSFSNFSNSSDSDTEVPRGKQLENIVSKLHLKHSACDTKEAKTSDSDEQNGSTKRYNMDETLAKRFCADNQETFDRTKPPAVSFNDSSILKKFNLRFTGVAKDGFKATDKGYWRFCMPRMLVQDTKRTKPTRSYGTFWVFGTHRSET